MFKSLFSKYITAFTSIIVISFLILILAMSSMVSNYSVNSKQILMESSAKYAKDNIETYMEFEKAPFTETVKKHVDNVNRSLKSYSSVADFSLFITDKNGVCLASSSDNKALKGKQLIEENIIDDVLSGKDMHEMSSLDGLFKESYRNFFLPVKDSKGNLEAIVLASSATVGSPLLVGTMQKTIVAAFLWVLLAAIICVYIISSRISEPIKNIGKAAKSFALGDFSVRVESHSKDEIGQLAGAFNNMAQTLEKTEDLRSTFLSNVSHDLRTPMTVISGYVDGILDGTIPPEKQNYYLDIISVEVKRLSRLVNSLLEISRMQSKEQKLNITKFNICEKARQILLGFEQKIDDKKLEIEFDTPDEDIYVNADSDIIHRVIYNLCDNAVKFTPEKGTIKISAERKDKKAVFTVRNSGDGIPKEELPYVFERFYKSDRSRGLDKTGTGLGLYISKTNINRHGEDLTVDSVFGEYCEFKFTLPVATK